MLDFIFNPHTKGLSGLLDKISARLREEKADYDFHVGGSKEETREIARRLSESGPVTIVAVGGDGTLNDVITGISVPENVTLGLLPFGTGNDFAEAAGIPFGIAALDLILHGQPKPTDFIECGAFRSINIAGLGIDVDILERTARGKGRGRGKYFRSLLASLRYYAGQKVEISVEGQTFSETAFVAAVCNGKQFGGGIPICPPALLDDGKLDLVVIGCPKRSKLLFLLIKLMRGKILAEPIARHLLCEQVRIVQTEGHVVQFDGELEEARVLEAHVVSGKLRMFRG